MITFVVSAQKMQGSVSPTHVLRKYWKAPHKQEEFAPFSRRPASRQTEMECLRHTGEDATVVRILTMCIFADDFTREITKRYATTAVRNVGNSKELSEGHNGSRIIA